MGGEFRAKGVNVALGPGTYIPIAASLCLADVLSGCPPGTHS
jgi:hypothetical protein